MTKKRIALLFGSFNPIHTGHLIIAESVASSTLAEEVWLVVSPQNPFKVRKNLLNQYDRLHLVQLAVEDNSALRVSNIEFGLPKPSYTIDTLVYLKEKYPDYAFSLIMGEDNLMHLHKWKNYEVLLKRYQIIVYPRPGYETNKFIDHPNVHRLEVPLLEISATYIRQRLKNGLSIRYLVPEKVYNYINGVDLWKQNKT